MAVGIAEAASLTYVKPLRDYYRCAELPIVASSRNLYESSGFFQFGPDLICYGQTAGQTSTTVNGRLIDISDQAQIVDDHVCVPFDIAQVVDNLRYEVYAQSSQRWVEKSWVRDLYYRLRPLFPIGFRKHLQTLYLSGWNQISFPAWPIDRTVDLLFEKLLVLAM